MNAAVKPLACVVAAATLAFAPSAFAGHWRHHGGWHHGHDHARVVRYHDGWRHRDFDRRRYYGHGDHFGRWVAGAVVLGALTQMVVESSQPRVVYDRPPPVVYSRTRVIVRSAPPVRVYGNGAMYGDPYQTRYLGHVGDDDDGGGD